MRISKFSQIQIFHNYVYSIKSNASGDTNILQEIDTLDTWNTRQLSVTKLEEEKT